MFQTPDANFPSIKLQHCIRIAPKLQTTKSLRDYGSIPF